MTPSIRSASRGSARSALSASRRQLRTRFTTRLESACATYRLRLISYDCSRQEGPMVRDAMISAVRPSVGLEQRASLNQCQHEGLRAEACRGNDHRTGEAVNEGLTSST